MRMRPNPLAAQHSSSIDDVVCAIQIQTESNICIKRRQTADFEKQLEQRARKKIWIGKVEGREKSCITNSDALLRGYSD